MTLNHHQTFVYVGLAGEGDNIGLGGLYRLEEGENKWKLVTNGLPENSQIRALLINLIGYFYQLHQWAVRKLFIN